MRFKRALREPLLGAPDFFRALRHADQMAVAPGPVRAAEPGVLQTHVSADYDYDERQANGRKHQFFVAHPILDVLSNRVRSLMMRRGSASLA